jgi:hypothetical protein
VGKPLAGGHGALCREIEMALAMAGQAGAASVTVHVKRSHMSANVKLTNGKVLPEIGLAVSDAPPSGADIKKFAAQIAASVRDARR